MMFDSEVQTPRRTWADEGPPDSPDGRVGYPGAVLRAPRRGNQATSFDAARLGTLLEDAVFGEWATEAAQRYHVSALDALGALAEALDCHQGRVHCPVSMTDGDVSESPATIERSTTEADAMDVVETDGRTLLLQD